MRFGMFLRMRSCFHLPLFTSKHALTHALAHKDSNSAKQQQKSMERDSLKRKLWGELVSRSAKKRRKNQLARKRQEPVRLLFVYICDGSTCEYRWRTFDIQWRYLSPAE